MINATQNHRLSPATMFAILLVNVSAISASAEESESTPATLPAAPATTTTTTRARAVSPAMAEKISLGAPKFAAPKPADEKAAAELPDRRELDKPKNGILRLPHYVVQEPKIPNFPQRELLTPKGKLDLAYKRRPGLRIGSLPFFSNNGVAMAMLEEEYKNERMAEMKELYGLMTAAEAKAATGK